MYICRHIRSKCKQRSQAHKMLHAYFAYPNYPRGSKINGSRKQDRHNSCSGEAARLVFPISYTFPAAKNVQSASGREGASSRACAHNINPAAPPCHFL